MCQTLNAVVLPEEKYMGGIFFYKSDINIMLSTLPSIKLSIWTYNLRINIISRPVSLTRKIQRQNTFSSLWLPKREATLDVQHLKIRLTCMLQVPWKTSAQDRQEPLVFWAITFTKKTKFMIVWLKWWTWSSEDS